MLFNLEPGGVGYSDKHRLATVKVNDEEGRNLPAEIYYIDDSQHFSIHHFRNLSSYRVIPILIINEPNKKHCRVV